MLVQGLRLFSTCHAGDGAFADQVLQAAHCGMLPQALSCLT